MVRWGISFLNDFVFQTRDERVILNAKLLKENKLDKVVANAIKGSMQFMLEKILRSLLMWL